MLDKLIWDFCTKPWSSLKYEDYIEKNIIASGVIRLMGEQGKKWENKTRAVLIRYLDEQANIQNTLIAIGDLNAR